MPIRYILEKNYIKKKLSNGDIVIEISGGSPTQSTGRSSIILNSLLNRFDTDIICTNFCRAIKPINGYSTFIYYYLNYLYDKDIFFSYENGTTGIKNLDIAGFLKNEKIIIPPINLIKRFDSYCNSALNQIFNNGKQNEQLENLRDNLLSKLFSNEIDVYNINI